MVNDEPSLIYTKEKRCKIILKKTRFTAYN